MPNQIANGLAITTCDIENVKICTDSRMQGLKLLAVDQQAELKQAELKQADRLKVRHPGSEYTYR